MLSPIAALVPGGLTPWKRQRLCRIRWPGLHDRLRFADAQGRVPASGNAARTRREYSCSLPIPRRVSVPGRVPMCQPRCPLSSVSDERTPPPAAGAAPDLSARLDALVAQSPSRTTPARPAAARRGSHRAPAPTHLLDVAVHEQLLATSLHGGHPGCLRLSVGDHHSWPIAQRDPLPHAVAHVRGTPAFI